MTAAEGDVFLAVNAGEIERWHPYKEATTITVKCSNRAFVCYRAEDGSFIDEFGDAYLPDGRVADAEDLGVDDNVLRLTLWQALPEKPGEQP